MLFVVDNQLFLPRALVYVLSILFLSYFEIQQFFALVVKLHSKKAFVERRLELYRSASHLICVYCSLLCIALISTEVFKNKMEKAKNDRVESVSELNGNLSVPRNRNKKFANDIWAL